MNIITSLFTYARHFNDAQRFNNSVEKHNHNNNKQINPFFPMLRGSNGISVRSAGSLWNGFGYMKFHSMPISKCRLKITPQKCVFFRLLAVNENEMWYQRKSESQKSHGFIFVRQSNCRTMEMENRARTHPFSFNLFWKWAVIILFGGLVCVSLLCIILHIMSMWMTTAQLVHNTIRFPLFSLNTHTYGPFEQW